MYFLLRDAAADERGAIADYLALRPKLCLMRFSRMLPKSEMEHCGNDGLFPGLIRSRPKCSQKKLDVLVMKRPIGHGNGHAKKPRKRRMSRSPPGKDFASSKAIQDELHAINKYQRYMNDAEEPALRELFAI